MQSIIVFLRYNLVIKSADKQIQQIMKIKRIFQNDQNYKNV